MTGASHLLPVPAALALLLAGAHFWRAGYPALSVFCGLLALLSWTRGAWVRQVLLLVLPLLAARWIWSAGQFVQLRQFMDQPWHRLAAILLGVALFTALATLPLLSGKARARYARNAGTARLQAAALGLTTALLAGAYALSPGIFLVERFRPAGVRRRPFSRASGPPGRQAGWRTDAPPLKCDCESGGFFRWSFSVSWSWALFWTAAFC